MSSSFSCFEIWLCPKVFLATAIFPPPLKAVSVTILITFFKASVFLSHVKNSSFEVCHLIQWLSTHSSVQFSHSIVSDSLWSHGLQHSKHLCPSPIAGACSNSCPSSWWCHPTISSSVPFSSCLQSFPETGKWVKWVSSLHQVAKVLKFQVQHQSFQWIFRTDFL